MAKDFEIAELSVEDVTRLVEERSPDVRAETAAKVARSFGRPELSERERAIALEIVSIMVRDVETRVRRALAENLKANPDLPHEHALRLANDVTEVATPILESSVVLSEADLIEIVKISSNEHRVAIAKRESVSEAVSDVLVGRGNETVVAALMGNAGARVAEPTMHKAVDRFGASERVNAAIVQRKSLPLGVAERLAAIVSDQLREQLVVRHELPANVAADLLLQARERAVIGLLGEGGEETDLGTFVAELQRNGRLTPTLILRALSTGDLDFFETALARLADIPVANAHRLIRDSGKRGLPALYEKCNMPPRLFAMVRAAVDVAAEIQYDGGPADRPRYVERMLERVLTQFEGGVDAEELDWMIGRLARAQEAVGKTAA